MSSDVEKIKVADVPDGTELMKDLSNGNNATALNMFANSKKEVRYFWRECF